LRSIMAKSSGLSADEIQQYDRQLRLWGITAQTRLRDSRVLLVNIGGLGAEVTKNLMLAGIGSLTILDAHAIFSGDLGSQFFLTDGNIGLNRAVGSVNRVCLLNPRVIVTVDTDPLESKDSAYFAGFDVVCLTECDFSLQLRVNRICRAHKNKILFFAADTFGWYGCFHEDLGSHDYTVSETKNEVVISNGCHLSFPGLEELSALTPEAVSSCFKARNKQAGVLYLALRCLQDFVVLHHRIPCTEADRARCMELAQPLGDSISAKLAEVLPVAGYQLNPICAIFGGVLSSEILKAISGQDEPWSNVMIFDGRSSECTTVMVK